MQAKQTSGLTIEQKIVLGVGAFLILKKQLVPKPPPADETPNNAQADADALAPQMPLSYPLSWYNSAADVLQSAMGGEYDGTDEGVINGVFMYANNLRDVLQIIAAFGVRPYDAGLFQVDNYSLSAWLSFELNNSELSYLNSILHNKGINYSF